MSIVNLLIVLIGLSIIDLKDLNARNLKRERAVYIGLMILAALFGVLYFLNPDQISLSGILFKMIGLEV